LRFLLLLALALALSAAAPLTATGLRLSAAAPTPLPPTAPAAPIHLRTGTFTPPLDAPPDAQSAAPGRRPGYAIVQFRGPVQEAWQEEVRKLGGVILDYVPEFAFIVYLDAAARAAVAKLPAVAWVGDYQPAFKLSPDLAAKQGVSVVFVQTFPTAAVLDVAAQAQALGATVLDASANAAGGLLRLQVDAAQLDALAAIPDVRWIEPFYERALLNDVARGDGIMGAETAWTDLGLYGQGQVVAVADTGLDTGNLGTLHQDFLGSPTGCTGTGRIVATYALGRTNNWSDSCRYLGVNEGGHGTHVSGSVLGNGCRSGSSGAPDYSGSYAGLAPQAGLVMQSVMDSSCGLGGLPSDLNTLYTQARTAGARIHTNSWGAAVNGQYTTDARNTDLFTWNNKDTVILFAAGNEGTDTSPANGFIDGDSLNAPGTAKNAITVGASENERLTGGYNPGGACSTWGGCWPSDYSVNPIKDDPLSDNPAGMVAFSSRGPTDDGRIKPDVVAPGSNILSTKSQGQYVSGGWGAGPNQYYQYMGGTSMATPLTAGAVALIRQFYTDVEGVTPSAALLKATLLNSATDLYPGQYASPLEHQPAWPNNAQGWGRVNVANAIDSSHAWLDIVDAGGLATGASHSYTYDTCGAALLKVTLVWTDYPGATLAAKALVNDLDLAVTGPDGVTTYRGNAFSNGVSVTGGAADRANNVESVYLPAPAAGTWMVAVSGYNVPNGSSGKQGYALVVDRPGYTGCNDFSIDATPARVDVCQPAAAAYTVNVGQLGSFAGSVALSVDGQPAGSTASFSANPVTPPASSTLTIGDTAAAAPGAYSIAVGGVSGASGHEDTVEFNLFAGPPAAVALASPAHGALGQPATPTFTWNAAAAATYDIAIATDPAFASIVVAASGLTATSFTPATALSSDTVYYWRVRGTNPCGVGSYSAAAAFRTAASSVSTFCRSPNLAIPDNNTAGVSDQQTIAATGPLTDLDVTVQASHTWVGDLVFTVQNVGSGASVTIVDRPGVPASTYGCSGNNIDATLDDEAAAAVESQCAGSAPAISGAFSPNNPLSAFDGQQLANTWRMTASDRVSTDTGTLTQWCLIATYGSAVAADYSDLPASYGAAWHTGNGSLRLGSAWTVDNSFPADGDNASDDGVAFLGAWQAGQPAVVRVNVQGTPAAGRWLRLWFDWDGDGAFALAERVFDGVVEDGANDLAVNVPASVTTAVAYRARLYDSAAAPAALLAADSAAYGGASGGEVEDGAAPCVTPGSVSHVTIAWLDASQVRLTWAAVAGAHHYEVWAAVDAPYFTPGANCAAPAPYACALETGTSATHAGLGDPLHNHTYVVAAVSACGGKSAAPSPAAGEFDFTLTPGAP
jgi:subtilisin family serine protease/subtilisin-like proprotein convertase family protein